MMSDEFIKSVIALESNNNQYTEQEEGGDDE
jgi:hypothetical protein